MIWMKGIRKKSKKILSNMQGDFNGMYSSCRTNSFMLIDRHQSLQTIREFKEFIKDDLLNIEKTKKSILNMDRFTCEYVVKDLVDINSVEAVDISF